MNWEPIRRGNTYCSSACGGGCSWADHLAAKAKGARLAKRLGKSWTFRVWENLGWHYEAISSCGRLKVHAHDGYTAFLGEPNSPGGKWAEQGKTPEAAILKTIRVAKADLARIGAIIQGL